MQIFSLIVILIIFFIIIGCIITDKVNRAIIALIGSVVVFAVLILIENAEYKIIVDYVIGTPADNFSNFKSLVLIISMMIIIEICSRSGLFQYIAFKLVQLTKGEPKKLLFIFCFLSVLLSMFLNNVLAVIILIPITITVCRILSVKPQPYILCEAVLVNIGATMFIISSIPNILISNYAGIQFMEFFLFVGIFSIVIFFLTIPLFYLMYGNKLEQPRHGIKFLLQYDAKSFISDMGLLKKSAAIFILLLIGFILIPSQFLPPEYLALAAAMILVLISKLNAKDIISKVDFELILYIIGIFIVIGGLEFVGIIKFLGSFLGKIGGGDPYLTFITILWASAYLSANIDNIPITRALLPVVPQITSKMKPSDVKLIYYGLAIGANWGDNLTPLGDNVIVMKIAEESKNPVSMREFFKLGFITTNYQLMWITIFISLMMEPIIGIVLLIIYSSFIGILFIRTFLNNRKKNSQSAGKNQKVHEYDDLED